MPLQNSTVDALGLATLVLIVLLCLASIFCVSYVLYFRLQIRRGQLLALREFNAFWVVRILLIAFAILWGAVELLRLPLLRREGNLFHSLGFEGQATLCRIYTVASIGFVEPCFFLSALFLVQGSVDAPFVPQKKWNEKAMGRILLCCLPVFVVQACIVLVSANLTSDRYSGGNKLLGFPEYFTRSFIRDVNRQDDSMCTCPLSNTLVLGLFSCIYDFCFFWQGWRMFAIVINKRLRARVCGLVLALGMLLPGHVLCMGLSVLSTPGEPLFELMAFLGFLTVLLCILVGEGILIVQPVADALAVRWVFTSLPMRNHNTTLDTCSVPLCFFEAEEDYNRFPAMKRLPKAFESLNDDKLEEISVSTPASISDVPESRSGD